MKFSSPKIAREALSEILNSLSDVEWLLGYALNDVYGPCGTFPCLSSHTCDETIQWLLPWVTHVKEQELSRLNQASNPRPELIYSFAPYLTPDMSADERGEAIFDSMKLLEELMRSENRYQYFVGNLEKEHKDIELEYDFTSDIFAHNRLCFYLDILFTHGGPYSLPGEDTELEHGFREITSTIIAALAIHL